MAAAPPEEPESVIEREGWTFQVYSDRIEVFEAEDLQMTIHRSGDRKVSYHGRMASYPAGMQVSFYARALTALPVGLLARRDSG
ncbi:hypothetical protein [Salininema proteolyticum]|uniref:Uncharacterized protein n=1 Tax=Salininema proteolyticum TaxID=1607685 RepID=A0ABV8U470_9ACTN